MMFRALQKVATKTMAVPMRTRAVGAVRGFAVVDEGQGKISIPADADLQGGRRKEELDAEAQGIQGFNKDPIVPSHDQGTKEKPILVPSGEHRRTIGYECPNTGQLVWFNLDQEKLHYVPDIGLYFKMQKI